jgi:membrane fusion protein, copper/silver efflux system
MRYRAISIVLTLAAIAAGGAFYFQNSGVLLETKGISSAAAEDRKVLYYRDPSGAPLWSAAPKRDAQGRDYKPVYDDEEPSFDPPKPPPPAGRKILYYRNPMGLPDVSPVPKKDPMGMDYIAVYEGEAADRGSTIKIDMERIQRSGVRTEKAQVLSLMQPVRGVGAVAIDERRLTVVTTRSDGYVEDLFVNTTGQVVKAGEPLFRFYSPDIQQAQADLISVTRGQGALPAAVEGTLRRLRNLSVPEARVREVRTTGTNPRTLDWPAPASGTVITKAIINGQRISAGTELYRIADLSHMWVIADVAEADLADIKPGTHATVTFRSYRGAPVEGIVTFIYPELRTETRTGRVRIEVANPDGKLKTDMYADVVFQVGGGLAAVTVPNSAVIDSGARQVVLVAKGEGRFEPRAVKLGRRNEDRVEIAEGLSEGEEVVSGATFLIDAESNLQTALKAFTQPEAAK